MSARPTWSRGECTCWVSRVASFAAHPELLAPTQNRVAGTSTNFVKPIMCRSVPMRTQAQTRRARKLCEFARAAGILLALLSPLLAHAEAGHPWRPPFGLERVGSAPTGPDLEAEARARPEKLTNPVDLGTILVPHDWLLLASRQAAIVDVAIFSRTSPIRKARLVAWFEGGVPVHVPVSLAVKERQTHQVKVPLDVSGERSVLHVSLQSDGRELWRKDIRTMVVRPSQWPTFGAVETKLRYDAPISIKDRHAGTYSTMEYSKGWNSRLNDVVVFLPNGERFVFWRGASYVPFWAGLYNTGLSYQWAETTPPPGAFKDAVEPLMDKELRYGRVQIVESTSSRVHVRWSYQSSDFLYKVFGDYATEDFYFYPDGFGTRVLTLTSKPDVDYEITEFIALLPQSAYPFEVLPGALVEMLFLDGQKSSVTFPYQPTKSDEDFTRWTTRGPDPRPGMPRMYRIFQEKRDRATAIYFSPLDLPVVRHTFKPFYDRGEVVTPGYWGNHWPLGRGATTGGAIDERIHLSPAHVSTFCWGLWSQGNRPTPLSMGQSQTLDALGQPREMITRRWAWLIGKTDAPDGELIQWAHAYSQPPSLELKGARIAFPSYSAERRAMRIVAESSEISIYLKPVVHTMNPVFEIEGAAKRLNTVTIDGKALRQADYAWDGKTLWIKASITEAGARIALQF